MRNHTKRLSVIGALCLVSLSSFASVLSISSIASVLSVASVASVLSISSVASVLSVGSTGCVLSVFKDCTLSSHPSTAATFTIHLDDSVFDTMKTCTRDEYRAIIRPAHCDYQSNQMCTYSTGNTTEHRTCKVRRKGNSSWRKLTDKPSFKIKLDDDLEIGVFDCGGRIVCPPGKSYNHWSTNKLTLNNMVQGPYNEIDAYSTFRKIGKKGVPLSELVTVVLMRGNDIVRKDIYTLVETIDDKTFVKKWFGSDYALWEVEYGASELERDGGALDYTRENGVQLNVLNMPLAYFGTNNSDMLLYVLGEQLIGHWDGACKNENNHYIVYDNSNWWIIPSGVDQTFKQCYPSDPSKQELPYCLFMRQCFADADCRAMYEKLRREVENVDARTSRMCGQLEFNTFLLVFLLTIAVCIIGFGCKRYDARM